MLPRGEVHEVQKEGNPEDKCLLQLDPIWDHQTLLEPRQCHPLVARFLGRLLIHQLFWLLIHQLFPVQGSQQVLPQMLAWIGH